MTKKGVAGAVLALLLLTAAVPARASLTSDQINSIVGMLNSFGVDADTVVNVQAILGGQGPVTTNTTAATASSCVTLSHNLSGGATDATTDGEVTKLQQFLGLSPTTGYFGPLTLQAVEAWQVAQGITSGGSADTTGYGFVGPRTRAAMSCSGSSTSDTSSTSSTTSTATSYSGSASATIDAASLTANANGAITLSGTATSVNTVSVLLTNSSGLTVFSGLAVVNSDGTWSAALPAMTSGTFFVKILNARHALLTSGNLVVGDGTGTGTLSVAAVTTSTGGSGTGSSGETIPADATGILNIGDCGAVVGTSNLNAPCSFSATWMTGGMKQVKIAVYAPSFGTDVYAYDNANSTGVVVANPNGQTLLTPAMEYMTTSAMGSHTFTVSQYSVSMAVLWGIPTGSTKAIQLAAGCVMATFEGNPCRLPGGGSNNGSYNSSTNGGGEGGSGASYSGANSADTSAKGGSADPGTAGAEGNSGSESSGGGSGGGACFAAGTPIEMADGSAKPIEAVQLGDMVMSYDANGSLTPAKVLQILVHPNQPVNNLNGILVTGEHRFLTSNGTYKHDSDLQHGVDKLVAADGSLVSDWTLTPTGKVMTVYNFTIEGTHTYIAGGFRVHNSK